MLIFKRLLARTALPLEFLPVAHQLGDAIHPDTKFDQMNRH